MPCYPFLYDKKLDKAQGWLCGKLLEQQICASCGFELEYLCDFPVGESGTCNKKLCDKCAFEIKPDIHLCPEHTIFYKDNSSSLYLHREIKKRYLKNTTI